jgi:hypothetical protein
MRPGRLWIYTLSRSYQSNLGVLLPLARMFLTAVTLFRIFLRVCLLRFCCGYFFPALSPPTEPVSLPPTEKVNCSCVYL